MPTHEARDEYTGRIGVCGLLTPDPWARRLFMGAVGVTEPPPAALSPWLVADDVEARCAALGITVTAERPEGTASAVSQRLAREDFLAAIRRVSRP